MQIRILKIALLILTFSLLISCARKKSALETDTADLTAPRELPAKEVTETLPASSEPGETQSSDVSAVKNPLTGQEVSDSTLLDRRPVAVKVQIFPRGQRPPWGISLADIVYDYYQNVGLTRFHSIFYGQNAETVGPIRSARLLDIPLVNMYKSIFVFGSAESRTLERLFNKDFGDRLIIEGYGTCPPLCRVDPDSFNYLVVNTAEVTNYANNNGIDNSLQNLEGMTFSEGFPGAGSQANQIFVRYSISSYNRWDYDPNTGRYLRFQDTIEAHEIPSETYEPMIDRLNNQQVQASNVVILVVPHTYAFGTKPGPGEVITIELDGTGSAYAFRDGQVYEVVWNKPNINSVLFLTFADGSPFPYKPGNTWYQVVGRSSKIENPGDGVLRFESLIP